MVLSWRFEMREGFSFGEDSREAGDGVGRVEVAEGIWLEWAECVVGVEVVVVVWVVGGAVVVILGWLWLRLRLWSNGGSGDID